MRIKRYLFIMTIILFITLFAGCPPQPLPADRITAKEAWEIIRPAGKTLGDDAVPVYLNGMSMRPEYPAVEGKAVYWQAGFYSESERVVWEVGYYALTDGEAAPSQGEQRYSDVSLMAYDLADWNIDSPEACGIAAQNGAGEINWIILKVAKGLDALKENTLFKTPEFIPDSTKILWVIADDKNDFYYIDASNGKYIGSCTVEYLDNIKD